MYIAQLKYEFLYINIIFSLSVIALARTMVIKPTNKWLDFAVSKCSKSVQKVVGIVKSKEKRQELKEFHKFIYINI